MRNSLSRATAPPLCSARISDRPPVGGHFHMSLGSAPGVQTKRSGELSTRSRRGSMSFSANFGGERP